MEKTNIIYSRYSSERSRKFAVRTDICEKSGERIVRKTPLYEEGKKHICHMLQVEALLNPVYQQVGWVCNHAEEGDNGICLEYLSGNTLEETIDALLVDGMLQEAEEKMAWFLDAILLCHAKESFHETEEFIRVFGHAEGLGDLKASELTNIDLVCGNLILNEIPVVLDYEWTFSFPIPVMYLLYRVIHYFFADHSLHAVMDQEKWYEKYGITPVLQNRFAEMEKAFQNYITGTAVPIRTLYKDIAPGTYIPDLGQEQKMKITFLDKNGNKTGPDRQVPIRQNRVHVSLEVPQEAAVMEWIPCEECCVLHIEEFLADGRNCSFTGEIPAEGRQEQEWIYLAKNKAVLRNIAFPRGTGTIQLTMEIHASSPVVVTRMMQEAYEKNKWKEDSMLKERIIEEMKHTKVWKLYEGIRNLREGKNRYE